MRVKTVRRAPDMAPQKSSDVKNDLSWYKENTGPNPHSLVAKAHMSCGHAHEDLKEYARAEEHMCADATRRREDSEREIDVQAEICVLRAV